MTDARPRLLPILLLLQLPAVPACSSGDDVPPTCNLAAEAAVVVTLLDADQQTPIVGATLVLSEGTYRETMSDFGDGTYAGGFERPGTYRVDASAAGYLPATVTDVLARSLPCGPETQNLTISLDPAPVQPAEISIVLVWQETDGTVTVETGRAFR